MTAPCARCLALGADKPRVAVCGDCRRMARGVVTLPYGHLPTLGYFTIHSGLAPAEARTTLADMRAELRKSGPTMALRDVLAAHNFAWTDAPGIEEDVVAVGDALRGET